MSKRKLIEELEARLKDLERKICKSKRRRHRAETESTDSSSGSTTPPRASRRPKYEARRHQNREASHRRREPSAPPSAEDDVVEVWAIRSPSPQQVAVPATAAPSGAATAAARRARLSPSQPSPPSPALDAPASPASSEPLDESQNDTGSQNQIAPANDEPVNDELDSELLEIFGADPTKSDKFGKDIQKDAAIRFEHISTSGLDKELRKELTEKFLIPGNAKLVDAPMLNPEIKAALSDVIAKRDKALEMKQKTLALVISAVGEAVSMLCKDKEKNPAVTRILMDAGRLLCDCQYNESLTRRNFILSPLKKEMKDQLSESKIDHFLFGEFFSETLKTARSITKSGAELKNTYPAKPPATKSHVTGTSKNWKSPYQARRRTTQPPKRAPATSKPPRQSSYKPWQSRRAEPGRR